jgi:hypothetical protein
MRDCTPPNDSKKEFKNCGCDGFVGRVRIRSAVVTFRKLADFRDRESGVTNECQRSTQTSAHDLHPPNTLLHCYGATCDLRVAV